ncbi:MAG TPA: hypothetical protein VGL58_07665 [Caulobacteraceae bacterium]|jgi:hypothetical protein
MAGNQRRPDQSMRLVTVGIVGVLLGTAAFGGYIIWSHVSAQQAAVVAPGDPDLDKPTAQECAIARVVLTAVHASGNDAAWRTAAGFKTSSLRARSEVVNPVDTPGFADDEADDLRAKAPADWRWCAGMGQFLVTLGWSPVSPDEDIAEVGLGRPGVNQAGDEAKVFEGAYAPTDNGVLHLVRGPWLVTLHKVPTGAWSIVKTDALPSRR